MINYLREIDSGRTTESESFFWTVSFLFVILSVGRRKGEKRREQHKSKKGNVCMSDTRIG